MYFSGTDSTLECRFPDASGDYGDWTEVAQLRDFQVSMNVDTIEIKQLGKSSVVKQIGYQDWSVTASGYLDYKSANGHADLVIGTVVDLLIMPEDHATGQARVWGKAIISDIGITTSAGEPTTFEVTFQGLEEINIRDQWPPYTPVMDNGAPRLDDMGQLYPPGTVLDPHNDYEIWTINGKEAPPFTPYTNGSSALVPDWTKHVGVRNEFPVPYYPEDAEVPHFYLKTSNVRADGMLATGDGFTVIVILSREHSADLTEDDFEIEVSDPNITFVAGAAQSVPDRMFAFTFDDVPTTRATIDITYNGQTRSLEVFSS